MDSKKDVAALVGRVLLALMFVTAGYGKITGYDGTAGMMEKAGLPMVSVLLPLTILVELGGGIALMVGWKHAGSRCFSPDSPGWPHWSSTTSGR